MNFLKKFGKFQNKKKTRVSRWYLNVCFLWTFLYKLNKNNATNLIKNADKKREKYYDYYTNTKWNSPENYDLVIDVSKVGIDGAVQKIVELMKDDNW